MSRERELLAECARVMRYVTLQPSDPNGTGSNNVDDQRAYYAALNAAERALLAEPEGGVGATYEGRPWRDVFPLPETVQTVASTPRSRTEAEAMLKRYHAALMAQSVPEDVADAMRERQRAYNALLAALTGGEG